MSDVEYIALLAESPGNSMDSSSSEEDIRVDPCISFHAFDTHHCQSFSSPSQIRIAPELKIHVRIVDATFCPTSRLNPYLYIIQLQYGRYKWTVRRRFYEFSSLHNHLVLFHTSMLIPMPTHRHKQHRKFFSSETIPNVPHFPRVPDFFIKRDDLPKRKEELEIYLREVVKIDGYRTFHATMEFFEISPLSFVDCFGSKHKEGYVLCKTDGYSSAAYTNYCTACCSNWCNRWHRRWLAVKDTFLASLNPFNGEVTSVLLFDEIFNIRVGEEATGFSEGLIISNYFRRLKVKCRSAREAQEWGEMLETVAQNVGYDFTHLNENGSFAPPRPNTECKWIVDGATYFEGVAEALEKAKEEIFLTGWWLTPELYMKRPTTQGHYWQLSYILKRKAKQGIKIYILIYKEVELALGINSAYTEQFFERLAEENIKVLRHPTAKLFFWAHHEKIVCIDQTYAFFGGLDICYGRWDDYQHRLTDLGEIEEKIKIFRHLSSFPKVSLPRRASSAPDVSILNFPKRKVRRSLSGQRLESESQLIMHPFKCAASVEERKIPTLKSVAHKIIAISRIQKMATGHADHGVKDTFCNLPTRADINRTIQNYCIVHLGIEKKFRLWYGKDYVNFISRDVTNLHEPYSDLIDRNVTPRMPWHDVGVFVQGAAAQDIARHFIQRWNYTKVKRERTNSFYPLLLPKKTVTKDIPEIISLEIGRVFRADCQILRSASLWSVGIETTEHSIQNAYINTIKNAQHYIYIENQFFVTQPAHTGDVFNGIADALYNKIIEAHRAKKIFRVYVVMPLLPAFEGEIGTDTGTVILAVNHWNYKSMCRGSTSLYERLKKKINDPSQYLYFYGLRKHSVLNNELVTELIYVHCKIMIVDDNAAIIGSANINDRSLLGRRDSEIAAKFSDCEFVNSVMDEKPYQAGRFCSTFRKALFREHLGLCTTKAAINIDDPISESFFINTWHKIALSNTKIYDEVFRCIPTDNVTTFEELKSYQKVASLSTTNPVEASKTLDNIQGHLVVMPYRFLCNENLAPSLGVKEGLLPNYVWT